jgi:hypothetical protein
LNYFGNSISFNGDGSILGITSYESDPNNGIGYIYQNVSNVYQFYQNIAPRDTVNSGSGEYANSISIDKSGLTFTIGVSSDNQWIGSVEVFTKCY